SLGHLAERLVLHVIVVGVGRDFTALHVFAAHRISHCAGQRHHFAFLGAFGMHQTSRHAVDPGAEILLLDVVVTADAHAFERHLLAAHVHGAVVLHHHVAPVHDGLNVHDAFHRRAPLSRCHVHELDLGIPVAGALHHLLV